MKIYKLVCNEVAPNPHVSISSYVNLRTKKWEKYFISEEKAKLEQSNKYKAATELLGLICNIEFIIETIEVEE